MSERQTKYFPVLLDDGSKSKLAEISVQRYNSDGPKSGIGRRGSMAETGGYLIRLGIEMYNRGQRLKEE